MRKRNTKGDCKVQTLALEIITPLNECTGGFKALLQLANFTLGPEATKFGRIFWNNYDFIYVSIIFIF